MIEFRSGRGIIGIISLFLIYALLLILILLFANQILLDVSRESFLPNYIVIPAAILLPLFLLGTIGLHIIRIIKDRRKGKPGTRFKIRLIIFFVLVAVLSAVPHAILSINFIDTAMNRWFFSGIIDGLKGGVNLSLGYFNSTVESLQTFGESAPLDSLIRDVERFPESVWRDVSSVNPAIGGMEVFNGDGVSVHFRGDERTKSRNGTLGARGEGLLPVEGGSDDTFLRYLKKYVSRTDEEYTVLFTVIVPGSLTKTGEQLTRSLESFTLLEQFQAEFKTVFFVFYSLFSAPIIFIAVLLSFRLSEEVIEPVVQIEEATNRVAEGDFSYRILGRSRDDLSFLVRSFNQMVSELESFRRKIQQTEKITAWQEIARRMAHEIKNPLTPIQLAAQRVLRKYRSDPDSVAEVLESSVGAIIEEVENLNQLLAEFSNFARLPEPNIQKESLREILDDVLAIYHDPDVNVILDDIEENLFVYVDKAQIRRVFGNILKNAFDAIEGSGSIFIRADLVRRGHTRYCRIQVRDTGKGIDPEYHNQVFNPYFTTKEDGTGLGLPIVERIIFDHDGQIWFESQENAGTTFFIDLPAVTEHE